MFGFGNCGLRNEIESLIRDLYDTGQCSTNWTNKPTRSWSFWSRSIFFRPYFHYYLSGFRCCKDRIQFQLLNRSLHIWFSYIHNHRFITYRDYYEPTWWPASLFMANVWRVGPVMERCGFEFWQRLSFLFCLGAGCKFLYFKKSLTWSDGNWTI